MKIYGKYFLIKRETLEEALKIFEGMSIESKAMMSMIAFKMDEKEVKKFANGKDKLSLNVDKDELETFTLLCKQKEQEGFFDKDKSDEQLKQIFEEVFSKKD